jgi:Xaa-Pro aminopeptidase
VTPDSCILWVREVYLGVYERLFERAPYSVRAHRKGLVERYFRRTRPSSVAFEDLSCTQIKALKRRFGLKRARIVDVIERLRMVKSPYEVSMIKRSASIATEGMRKAYEVVKEGVPELYAVASVEAHLRRLGSETPPFEGGMILAGGAHGADIHATPSFRRIRRGLVVVDLGARFRGYHSDLTRTVSVGGLTMREKKLSEAVMSIRDESVDRLCVGVKASDVAGFAEEKIRELGFRFHHALGHGVGLAIHERPSLSLKSKDVLTESMVFTIEPGIYVPGKYGIRFEDTVHLTTRGPKILTEV